VALTRAREQTHLYASVERLDAPADEHAGGAEQQLVRLAEQLGRAEPELPSISIALARERQAEREHAEQSVPPRQGSASASSATRPA